MLIINYWSYDMTKRIAIYGTRRIGKSTITSNLSAALADMGYSVMQVGCDPKNDSTRTLRKDRPMPTVLDTLRTSGDLNDIVFEGYKGVFCVEIGEPEPGVGCSGNGIITAVDLLNSPDIIDKYAPDIIIYDIIGDIMCDGFTMPIRQGIADQAYAVVSSDYPSIDAVNNIFKSIARFGNEGGVLLGGIIGNSITSSLQEGMINEFASRTNTEVIKFIPKSSTVTRCELDGVTTIEGAPRSLQTEAYRSLANKIMKNEKKFIPTPFDKEELLSWSSSWISQLVSLEKTMANNIHEGPSGI